MHFDLISKYRTQLMGLAILWVMFYHSPLSLISYPILSQFKNMGYGGVDIFMFLSGFGIYYSLSNSSSVKDFYLRRIWRILPYYIPIALAYSIVEYLHGELSLIVVILNALTLSYWFGLDGHFEWYIPTILFFYLISPRLYSLLREYKIIALIAILLISFLVFFLIGGSDYSYLLLTVGRFPLFCFGMWFGDYMKEHKDSKCPKFLVFFLIGLLIVGVFLWNYLFSHYWGTYWSDNQYGLLFIPFWIMTFSICLLVSYCLSLFENYKYPILTFFGVNTLIFYILHERIMAVLHFYNIPYITIVALALTVILGVLWKKAVDRVLKVCM